MASFSQDDGLLDDDSQLPDEIYPPPKPRPLPRQCLPRLILTGGGVRQQEDDSPFSAQEAMASMLPPNTPLTTDGRWPPSRVFWCVSRACYARVPTLRARDEQHTNKYCRCDSAYALRTCASSAHVLCAHALARRARSGLAQRLALCHVVFSRRTWTCTSVSVVQRLALYHPVFSRRTWTCTCAAVVLVPLQHKLKTHFRRMSIQQGGYNGVYVQILQQHQHPSECCRHGAGRSWKGRFQNRRSRETVLSVHYCGHGFHPSSWQTDPVVESTRILAHSPQGSGELMSHRVNTICLTRFHHLTHPECAACRVARLHTLTTCDMTRVPKLHAEESLS
jgi:hypothetical protein